MLYASRFLRLMTPPMEGPDVLMVQRRLKELGHKLEADGVFGPTTEQAVKSFQKANGLLVDGIVGPDTYQALQAANAPTFSGPRVRVGQNTNSGRYRITVDTGQKILTLNQNSRQIKVYPVAVGKPETPTPLGDWTIVEKQLNPGGPFGARWMRLSVPWGGYGIHGTDNPPSIGTAASHGCVRMYNEDVIELYDMVPIGTPVKIIGQAFTGRILREGVSPGNAVSELQRRLSLLGYYRGDIDGFYGPLTRQAVMDFQTANGLAVDGIVGPQTYQALEKAYDIATDNRQP